ncbi:hypothetical protein [Streptacidiphilus sp. PAMC 29251]
MLQAVGLSTQAEAVYRTMLDHPVLDTDELAVRLCLSDGQIRDCLDELAALKLVRASGERPGQMWAVSPEVGLADMLAREDAALAARQAQLAASRAAVTRMVADRATTRAAHGERLLGMDAIQSRLAQMGCAATAEVRGIQPDAALRPTSIAAARIADDEALSRGIRFKSLFPDAGRKDPLLASHTQWLASPRRRGPHSPNPPPADGHRGSGSGSGPGQSRQLS